MAKKITVRGFIGWDENATPEFLARELKAANGEDIDLEFSSGGGFVFAGLEMANMVRNYSGRVVAKVTGLAASMASYIPMMADEMIVEDNAVFMIHNPMSGIFGADYRDAEKLANYLRGMRNVLGKAYAAKSGKDEKTIHSLMDDETFLFGQEIVDEGFANGIILSSGDGDKATALAIAQAEISEFIAKMKQKEPEARADFERAAAYLKIQPTSTVTPTPASAGRTPQEATKMSLTALLAANPDAQAEYDSNIATAKAGGKAEGVTEGKAQGVEETKAVYDVAMPIISSAHYPEALKKRVMEKAQAGDVEVVNDFVALYDMTAEGIATAAAIAEASAETPGKMPTKVTTGQEGLIGGDDVASAAKAMREG